MEPILALVAFSFVSAVTAVIVPTAALWAAAGGTLQRLLTSDRRRRIVSFGLAGLVVATVASVWL